MRTILFLALLTATGYASPPSLTTPYPLLPPQLTIYDATTALTDKGGSSAVSMVIHNPENHPVTIVRATSPMAARVMMQHYIRQNGVTQIYPLDQLEIPAKADLTVVPFGLEMRLLETTQPLTYGMDVPLTLTFDNGSQRTIRLTIQNPDE